MTIKQRKLILHFLELLETFYQNKKSSVINPVFLHLFSRKELIEIALWIFTKYDKTMLSERSDTELLDLIGSDACVLSFVLQKWRDDISAVPQLTQKEVHEFFDETQVYLHYLRDKPVENWDSYDISNYYSLLFKRGKTKRVFAIFTSDVRDEDKYVVTTKPSFFFDTKEEAEEDLQRFCKENTQNPSDFVIHSLWKITEY